MDKIVIYTCIIGGYDALLQPLEVREGFDYVCFVGYDEDAGREGVWEKRPLPLTTGDKALDSRYPKMHPHELLPGYDCSLWIDGNILLKGPALYDAALAAAEAGTLYAGVSHPQRDCMYEEAVKCRDMRYIGYPKLARIILEYLFCGIKRHSGLLENNIIFRRHNDPAVVRLDEMWWSKVLHFCRRDQLSLMLCLRECGIEPSFLLPRGVNSRNCPGLEYRLHTKKS